MAIVSSHTLNGLDGSHATGVGMKLVHLESGDVLFDSKTDKAGRLSQTINLNDAHLTGLFELTLETRAYWRTVELYQGHVIEQVVHRFAMPDAQARYHMPFILSPNSYSMWASKPEGI